MEFSFHETFDVKTYSLRVSNNYSCANVEIDDVLIRIANLFYNTFSKPYDIIMFIVY